MSYLNSLVLDLVFSKNISIQWGVFQTVVIKQNMRVVTGLFVFFFCKTIFARDCG